jgi:hypothetical protein
MRIEIRERTDHPLASLPQRQREKFAPQQTARCMGNSGSSCGQMNHGSFDDCFSGTIRSWIRLVSQLLMIAIVCLLFSFRVYSEEKPSWVGAVWDLPEIAKQTKEALEKVATAQREIDTLRGGLDRNTAKLKQEFESLTEKTKSLTEETNRHKEEIRVAKNYSKLLLKDINALSQHWNSISEKIKEAEEQLNLAKKEAAASEITQAKYQKAFEDLKKSEIETRQRVEDWKQAGLLGLKILGVLIIAGYLIGITTRLFVRFRGVMLNRFPLSISTSLDRKTREWLKAIPPGEKLLLIDENQSKLEIGMEPFHYFGSGFLRFPTEGEITRLRWKGMFFYRLRRKRWWAWKFTGAAEIASDDPLEEPMIVNLREAQDLYLNPDFLLGHDEKIAICAYPYPDRWVRFFSGQPLKCIRATGAGRILLAAHGGLKCDPIIDLEREKPIPSKSIVAWTGSADLGYIAVSSSKSEAFGNWIIDALQNLPLLGLIPFVKLDSVFANLLRPIIPPQPDNLIQVRFQSENGLRGEVILARSLAHHLPASSFSTGGRKAGPLVNITILGT